MHCIHSLEPFDGNGNQAGKHVPKENQCSDSTDFDHGVHPIFERRKWPLNQPRAWTTDFFSFSSELKLKKTQTCRPWFDSTCHKFSKRQNWASWRLRGKWLPKPSKPPTKIVSPKPASSWIVRSIDFQRHQTAPYWGRVARSSARHLGPCLHFCNTSHH